MYCNSCLKQIPKDKITRCKQCGVPLCTTCANHCMVCGKELCDSCYAENNFKCEDCYKPNNTFDTIRRSHIEQYVGCQYSLYLQLILGITPPMGKHAQLGVIVHEIIENANAYSVKTLAECIAELEKRVAEWNESTEDEYSIITMELEEIGKECLKNYFEIKNALSENTTQAKAEYNIKFSIDKKLPNISCTLDRIRWDSEGNIHIHDWKTGKPMAGKKLVEDLQPPLYIYAVYKEFGIMPKSFTLHYLQTDKHITYRQIGEMEYEVKTTRNTYILDINEALGRTIDVLKKIKNNKFSMPKTEWRCNNMCWFGLSGKCDGATKAEWKEANEQYKKIGESNGKTKEAS